MLYRYLGKYNEFKCIADKCPDTCCSGWQIVIDEDTYAIYKNDKSGFFDKTIAEADGEYFFNQRDNGDCIFLKGNGLCHLICEKGEAFLCDTCASYPRHVEEFPGVKEHSLSISCPVVAKQLLEMDSKDISFFTGSIDSRDISSLNSGIDNRNISSLDSSIDNRNISFLDSKTDNQSDVIEMENVKTDDNDDYQDFDYELYDLLVSCRDEVVRFIIDDNWHSECEIDKTDISTKHRSDRAISDIDIKKAIITSYMRRLQDEWDAGDEKIEELSTFIDKGLDSKVVVHRHTEQQLLEMLMKLEPLKVDFRDMLCDAYDWICKIGCEEYELALNSFKVAYPDWQRYYKNIVLYFIYSYMCGAVYDEFIYSMSMLGFYCADILMILWTYQMDTAKTGFDCSEVLYRFSRELENSNDNMILFEQLIEEI